MKFIYNVIGTFFYAGYFPLMPGTFASLCGAIIWFYLFQPNIYIQLSLIIFTMIIGTIVSTKLSLIYNKKDPSFIVIDEICGVWISFFLIPQKIQYFILGLIIFRLLDIFKPLSINSVQYYSGGYGIMADDILAGIVTNILLNIWIYLL